MMREGGEGREVSYGHSSTQHEDVSNDSRHTLSLNIHCSCIHIHDQHSAWGGIPLTAPTHLAVTMNYTYANTLHTTSHTCAGEQWTASSLHTPPHSPPDTAEEGELFMNA